MNGSNLSIRARTSVGRPLPRDHQERIKEFRERVMAETGNIFGHNLDNFDEIPVPLDIVGSRTADMKGKDNIL